MQKKTSIDGLAVRTPSNRRVSGSVGARGQKVMDVAARPHRIVKTKTAIQELVEPVINGTTLIPEDSLAQDDSSNWSNLVDEMNQTELLDHFVDDDSETDNSLASDDEKDILTIFEEDEEKSEEPKEKKPTQKPKKEKKNHKRRKRRIILGIIAGLLVIIVAMIMIWGDWIISKLTGGNSGIFDAIASFMSDAVPFETDENGRTNVLVFGTEGYNMDGDTGNGGTHDGADLTDSIMIISFDQKTKDVALISLPRDLKVRKACYAGKVNEVYTCNNDNGENEKAGAEALAEQVGEIFGIDFQYWVHVNWGSLVEIVDTLGGIDVTLDEDVNDRYYTGIVAKAGEPIHLSGVQAVGLARARHGTAGGDFSRGNSQQKILMAIAQRVVDRGIGVTEAFNLINILGDNLRSNFSTDNFKSGVYLLSEFNPNTIRQVPLVDYDNNIYYVKTATINGISYVVPQEGEGRYTNIQAYIDKMISSNPAMREDATIAIYNATETPGVAGAEQEKLVAEGYNVIAIGDAEAGSCGDEFCVYNVSDAMPATVKAMEDKYGVSARGVGELPASAAGSGADVVVIIGRVAEAGVE